MAAAASVAVVAEQNTAAAHSVTAAVQWQQRGGYGGGISMTAQLWCKLDGGAETVAASAAVGQRDSATLAVAAARQRDVGGSLAAARRLWQHQRRWRQRKAWRQCTL